MNLWRRSKSWFTNEGFSEPQKEHFDAQAYLDHEKELLNKKYEREKKSLEEEYEKHLSRLRERFLADSRQLQEKHSRLSSHARKESREQCSAECVSRAKKSGAACDGDELEWDPSDELKSYSEDEVSDAGWDDVQSDGSRNSCNLEPCSADESELSDSAYSSLSSFIAIGSAVPRSPRAQLDTDIERKFEQFRIAIRQEVLKECEKKFQQERKFFYSIIDELEESVSLMQKQKEDIVSILEHEAKEKCDI